ncbi:MAG TPA: hypothetical protein VLB02_00635 [Candidatus Paceibacterota bacterium]|nr:hypothetical protein [Candidatus Paceibacterota bacterium]
MFETTLYAAEGIQELVFKLNKFILNPLIILAFSLALAYFLWGLVAFIKNAANAEARKTGQQHMLWGIVGMVIMVSALGIINLLVNVFGIKGVDVEQQTIKTQAIPPVKIKGFNTNP